MKARIHVDYLDSKTPSIDTEVVAEYPFYYVCERTTESGDKYRICLNKADLAIKKQKKAIMRVCRISSTT